MANLPEIHFSPSYAHIAAILRKAELSPPPLIPALTVPHFRRFTADHPSSVDEGRAWLVEQRTGTPGYRQPELQRRHAFRSKKSKDAKCNTERWSFTRHEVAKAFNDLLSHDPLPRPGVAQALLSHAPGASLDDLWSHLHDSKLEKKVELRHKTSKASGLHHSLTSAVLRAKSTIALPTLPAIVSEMKWLDEVCRQDNIQYIRLLCQVGVGQDALDRAFGISLEEDSMDAMELLLKFGATASACQDDIQERIKLRDVNFVRLLLSAPKAMTIEAWRSCLEGEVQSLDARSTRSPELLLLCFAHRPDIASIQLLQRALELQNIQIVAILLAYGGITDGDYFSDVCELVCKAVCRIQDKDCRHKFFTILVESGYVMDGEVLREELVKDVKARHLPMIKLLVNTGVIVDKEPHSSFYWAVSRMDLDILELFKPYNFTSPISLALNFVPNSTPESDVLRLMGVLGPLGLAGQPLDTYLIGAVQRRHTELVGALILHGASVEFEQASAIHTALENADLDILNILLQSQCSPAILSTKIPIAMGLKLRDVRFQAMKALLDKGLWAHELAVPLKNVVSEEGDVESELVQLLLQNNAPVDGVGNDLNNPVSIATLRGNFPILKILCGARPRVDTLSRAVPIAFNRTCTFGQDATMNMMRLLLETGAAGVPIHLTLLAAVKQNNLDIVRLLVKHGADANHSSGASFGIALKTSNLTLFQVLCTSCPVSRSSLECNFFVAIDPRYYTSVYLELLLSSTRSAGTAINALWSSEKLRGNPDAAGIVACLLRYGLDVNLKKGIIITFAIREKHASLLERILLGNPNIVSLAAGFHTAANIQPRSWELDAMRLLLEKAKSAEIGQSEALLREITAALTSDFDGLRLLLRHKAVANSYTFTKACLATASSTISRDEKQEIFESLLASSKEVLVEDMSKLLGYSVMTLPEDMQLPTLLIAYGAEIKLEVLKEALSNCSLELLKPLISSVKSADTALGAFRHARQRAMASGRKYMIYQLLLDRDIPKNDLSEALAESMKSSDLEDLSIQKLLLDKGACPGYQGAKPFLFALASKAPNSLIAVKLMTQHLTDNSMAEVMFETARKASSLKNNSRVEICRSLLEWNISKSTLTHTLADCFKNNSVPEISFLKLLLEKGANPNTKNGVCFGVAAKTGALAEFRALCKYGKKRVIIEALLNHLDDEKEIIKYFDACLEGRRRSKKIDDDLLAFQCMRKFPKGAALLNLLLDQGVSAAAKKDYALCPGWKPEPCTALIWALFSSKPRIENDVIFVLLSRRNEALPAYSTPITKVSAAFGCLLDKTRLHILECLLYLDRDPVLDYVIPGSSFGPLAMSPKVLKGDSEAVREELPLRLASLYLGNFEAFCMITPELTPNDGTLHLAAFFALPKFVQWLLTVNDPDYKVEEFDNAVPLACVCASKPNPWSKIANEESDWRTRQKDTMHLLARVTSPKWRYRNMTILHYSMDHGTETVKAMVTALAIREDPQKDEKYLYKDRDGIEYSPQQYVLKVLGVDENEKKEMIACLEGASLRSRYFKRVLTGNATQPEDHHGFP